ncbi:dormancy-associated protein homolog 4 [Fagus crenata]
MGFLHKLWDETLAGPPPETGLGKLRKFDSFSATRSPPMVEPHDDNHHHQVPVTRSITILRTNSNFKNPSVDSGSAPVSPAGSSTPGTPFTPGTPGLDFKKITRRKPSAAKLERDESSPRAYDWIVMSALDR